MIHNFVLGHNFYLYNWKRIPAVGLSTCRIRSTYAVNHLIEEAFDAGYRMFDTSPLYCNEVKLGQAFENAISKYRLKRDDIFISSKLFTLETPSDTIRSMCTRTMENMGIDYIDLYLISSCLEDKMCLKQAWDELITLYREGKVHAIGVANFKMNHFAQLDKSDMIPMVNQVEWHPFAVDEPLYIFCKDNNILLQGHSPFGSPLSDNKHLFKNRLIKKLARKYEVTPAQIALMWAVQLDVSVVPASLKLQHLRENIDFELTLSDRDLDRISLLAPSPIVSESEL